MAQPLLQSKRPPLHLLFLPLLIAVLPTSTAHRDYPCKPPYLSSFPFCNTSLPIADRALSLISHLTLQEKIHQLSNTAAAVPRLGLPPYEWWSESLHGLAGNGPGVRFNGTIPASTVFPQVILSAASFNRTLWRAVAGAIAIEARAMYNADQAGLTFWAPNINIFRDPRWGRGQETPGEDPMVTSLYAVDYVYAFQSQLGWTPKSSFYGGRRRVLDELGGGRGLMMLSSCCKHHTAYDLEKWRNFTRYTFDAQVSEQDMEDTFQPPFRACIKEGGASCLMCSYNQVNGVPSCARGDLLTEIREQWGFEGYVTSDCDAVAIIFEDQKYASSPEDALADVLKAGMDINCGTYMLRHMESALKLGKVREEDIDRSLFNLFSVLLRLQFFDGDPAKQQYGELGASDVCTKEHRELALEAARQGVVLLKNEGGHLPLRSDVTSMALIGPAGDRAELLGGGYSGVPCDPKTFLDGLTDYVPSTTFAAGCANTSCVAADGFDNAVRAAGAAEVVVVVAGLNLTEETEDHDRVSLLLPGKQEQLVGAIASVSKKPVILVLMGGGPLDVSFAKEDPRIAAIIWIGYPGEVGGQVLAEALFGDFNPGGRLPVTWYPESFTAVPMNDMNMRADPSKGYPGRTYRFYTGGIVYDYGYGLSYSTYAYKILSAPLKVWLSNSSNSEALLDREPAAYEAAGEVDCLHIDDRTPCEDLQFGIKVSVVNNGDMEGSHAVLLFSRSVASIRGSPKRQLVGFERVFTAAHGETVIEMLVDPCKHMSTANEQGKRILVLGVHIFMLGDEEHQLLITN